MTKYHINPETGNPNICNAKIQCRFGGEDIHSESKQGARDLYEKKMSEETVPTVSKKDKESDPEVESAKTMLLDTGDLYSHIYNKKAASNLATRTGMKEEKIQKALDFFIQEEKDEQDAKFKKSQEVARDVAKNTDPDLSKIKKGSTVAYKVDDSLVTVQVTSKKKSRSGKTIISGKASDGTYADQWDVDDVLTSDSKAD